MTEHVHLATRHIDSRVQRSCRHTTCTPTAKATYTHLNWLSSGTTSAHITGLHRYHISQYSYTHTSINAHHYKR